MQAPRNASSLISVVIVASSLAVRCAGAATECAG